jgi:hypothetical protein
VAKKTWIEDGDNDEEESEAVTTRSKNNRTENEVRVQRKIRNKPIRLASEKVAKSKAAKKGRNTDGASSKKRKRNGNQ